jgi:hypothetical protein
MDIPQFKEVIQRLSVLKRHSSLMVPIVIALVGVLLLLPAQLMSSKLKKKMSEESVMNRSRQVSSLRENTPASDQWKLEKERQQAYKSDANQISLLAKELTRRRLLSDKIFPEPTDKSISLFKDYGKLFRSGVDELLRGVNAGECPSGAELQRSLGGLSRGTSRGGRPRQGTLSTAGNEIKDALCRSKAESAHAYCNPTDLSGYEFWEEYQYAGTPKAVEDCWYYQLAYWIIEDVIDTIDTMNSGSNTVLESSVKRLLGIDFGTGVMGSIGFRRKTAVTGSVGTRRKAAVSPPSYVLTVDQGLTVPFTGRVCNSDIDVVHFNVSLIVDAKDILRFMQQLCSAKQHVIRDPNVQLQNPRYAKHNQITILESRISSINRQDETHDLYRYGEDAVVELDLICEYVFSKKGYDDIKPASVKQSLMLPAAPPGMDPRYGTR